LCHECWQKSFLTNRAVGNFRVAPYFWFLSLDGDVTVKGVYCLGTWDLKNAPGKNVPTVAVDATAGARYTYLGIELDIKGFPNWDVTMYGPILGLSIEF